MESEGGDEVVDSGLDEGWYIDPYGIHDARWISTGKATKLVRDGQVESYDEPPDSPPIRAATRIEPPPGSVTSADTLRADDAEATTMPSLAELEREEMSVAISTEAHQWILTRRWYPRNVDRRSK
jgi:hypothetical protein